MAGTVGEASEITPTSDPEREPPEKSTPEKAPPENGKKYFRKAVAPNVPEELREENVKIDKFFPPLNIASHL